MQLKPISGIHVAALSFVMLAGCGESIDIEAERENLLATDREFARHSEEHGAAAAFRAYLVEDALQLPHGSAPVSGRDNIYNGLAQAENLTLLWQPRDGDVSDSGDMGWTWGTYQAVYQGSDSEDVTQHGKYLNIWLKQGDGTWRVRVDLGNHSPSP